MREIDRRSFITELRKLVPFMEEQDRETALSMFEKMFDSASNEAELLTKLVSPTRQAVNIARAYDAAARKAAIEENDLSTPDFVNALTKVAKGALGESFSFEEIPAGISEAVTEATEAAEETAEAPSEKIEDTTGSAAEEAPEEPVIDDAGTASPEVAEVPDTEEEKAPEKEETSEEEKVSETSADDGEVLDIDRIIAVSRGIYDDDAESDSSESTEEIAVPERTYDVDGFLDSMEVEDEISAAESLSEKLPEEDSAEIAEGEKNEEKTTPSKAGGRKVKVGLLILYVLLAVPICSVAIMAILAVAAALVLLAFAAGKIAILGIGTAFGCYAVFADILIVIGTSLIVLALGILLIWTAVWLVGGVMVGLIKAVFRLADKWCTREVEAS